MFASFRPLSDARKPAGSRPGPSSRARRSGARPPHAARLGVEFLESRELLSVAPPLSVVRHDDTHPLGSSNPNNMLTPAQIRAYYGVDQIKFHFNGQTVAGDGRGQTIAIIDAYDSYTIADDLRAFSNQFGLPAMDGLNGNPLFRRVAQDGSWNFPKTDPGDAKTSRPAGSWEGETALDVEWAHAIAPRANILLVEANDSTAENLARAIDWAKQQPGVSVVSMSLGTPSAEAFPSRMFDQAGVTFVASSGDKGVLEYPGGSLNVVTVGGTTLKLDDAKNITGEVAWDGSGGGVAVDPLPAYQSGIVPSWITHRAAPDVAYYANSDNSGVAVYDSFNNGTAEPWDAVGGTSAGAPQWAALIAIADQGRALRGLGPLRSSDTLTQLYALHADATFFNDIVSGTNKGGNSAGPGYDLVTGLGSPHAEYVVTTLVGGPVGAGGRAPQAANDTYSGALNGTLSIAAAGVLANDKSLEGDRLSATLVSGPGQGQLTLKSDGSFVYTPRAGFQGFDWFRYRARDINGYSQDTVVTLVVGRQPVANADHLWLPAGSSIHFGPADLVANDAPTFGTRLTVSVTQQPQNGSLTYNADGSFTYTPQANFHGQDTFKYTYNDQGFAGTSTEATVTIDVSADFVLNNGRLTALGAADGDKVQVDFDASRQALIALHGTSYRFDPLHTSGGTRINVNGQDYIFNLGRLTGLGVQSGAGAETVTIGSPGHRLDDDPLPLAVTGNGATLLVLNDQGTVDTARQKHQAAYTIAKDLLTRQDTVFAQAGGRGIDLTYTETIAYSGLSGIALTGGSSPAAYTVQATPVGTALSLTAGSAAAVITVLGAPEFSRKGPTAPVSPTTGPLTIDAAGGTLILDDRATKDLFETNPFNSSTKEETNVTTFTVTDNQLVRQNLLHQHQEIDPDELPPGHKGQTKFDAYYASSQTIGYRNVRGITIWGGAGRSTTFNVSSTATGTPLTVNAGSSANRFTVGSGGTVKNVHSLLTLNGDGAGDALVLDDSAATVQDAVTVAPAQAGAGAADQFFGSGGRAAWSGLASVTVNLSNAFDDKVHLSPAAGTAFAINGSPAAFQAGRGAVLDLDLTGVTNPANKPAAPGSGQWTFGNRQAVAYTGMAVPFADVTARLTVSMGLLVANPTTGRASQTVTLRNTGTAPVVGPLSLVLDGLTAGILLLNRTGATQAATPAGSPYIDVALPNNALDVGQSVTVFLDFAAARGSTIGQPITYRTRVLAGTGPR
jgi:hypothetical protein